MPVYAVEVKSQVARGGFFKVTVKDRSLVPACKKALVIVNRIIRERLTSKGFSEVTQECYLVDSNDVQSVRVDGKE